MADLDLEALEELMKVGIISLIMTIARRKSDQAGRPVTSGCCSILAKQEKKSVTFTR